MLLGAFGPTLSAIGMTWAHAGRSGVARLLRPLFGWRIAWWWYPVLLLPPVLWCLALLIGAALLPIGLTVVVPWYLFPLALVSSVLGGPIAEEVGWRGYLVPS